MMSEKKELVWGPVRSAWKQLSALQASVGDLRSRIKKSQYAIADSESYIRKGRDALNLDNSGGIFQKQNGSSGRDL